MSLEGQQLGRYRIVRLLGSGGMGDVYLAQDERIEQQVALKVIRVERSPYPDSQDIQQAERLFRREAKAIALLDHPHILPLFDYGEQHIGEVNVIYLVMPYRPEGSLAQWMSQHGRSQLLSTRQVAHIVLQAASALQHAHDRQIIHQDVKPSNYLIRSQDKTPAFPDLFLADFGIAKLITSTSSISQSIRGTPTYMAPEQWEGKPVPASDQYALAIMTYELLTGRPPFQGAPGNVMYQHLTTAPTPPAVLNPRLSPQVDTVILQALAKQAEQRFASVTAFAYALEQALQSLDQATDIVNSPATSSPVNGQLAPDSGDSSSTLAASGKHDVALPCPSVLAVGEESTPAALPVVDKAQTPAPDSPTTSGKTTNSYRGFNRKRSAQLIGGGVLLLLLLSSGFIYATITNRASSTTPAAAIAQTKATSQGDATGMAQTSTATLAAQATGTAIAENNTTSTAVARNEIATQEANATATAQARPTPTPTPIPQSSSLKILGAANNLSGYCQSIGDSSASLDGNTAYSWACVTSSGQHVAFSMTAACRWQYENSGALDRLGNYFDPHSWECWG